MKIGICVFLLLLTTNQNAKAFDLENNSRVPILVLASNNSFGLYTGEILKTEGFNEFLIQSPEDEKLTLYYLKKFDVVILAENSLTAKQQSMFSRYVKEGGNL